MEPSEQVRRGAVVIRDAEALTVEGLSDETRMVRDDVGIGKVSAETRAASKSVHSASAFMVRGSEKIYLATRIVHRINAATTELHDEHDGLYVELILISFAHSDYEILLRHREETRACT